MPLKFPVVKDVACSLRAINATLPPNSEVTLQILDNGDWWIHAGTDDDNLEMHGYTSHVILPGRNPVRNRPGRFNSIEVARVLIDEAADKYIEDKNG